MSLRTAKLWLVDEFGLSASSTAVRHLGFTGPSPPVLSRTKAATLTSR